MPEAPKAGEELDARAPLSGQPKRTMRTVTVAVMAITALVTGWLAWSLRHEAAFALRSQTPTHVGILVDADLPALDNHFVRGYARLDGATSLGYRRPLESDPYRVAQAAPTDPGGPDVWVIYGVPPALDGPRFVPPSLVAGRLARVDALGVRFRGIESAIRELSGKPDVGGAYVVIDGEDPEGLGWLLGFEVMLLGFVAFNVASIARLLRRIRPDAASEADGLTVVGG